MESQNYYNILLYQLWSWVSKLRSELHDFIGAGIEFQRDAPENEKLVLKRSILGLGRVMVRDEARVFEQMNIVSRYGGARLLHALNTSTALLNLSLSLSESKPKCCSLVSTVTDGSGSISLAALLWRELSFFNRRSLQPSQTVDA